MDYKATLMALVLVSSALAGCTGDPDGGGGDEIDSGALQNLFDEHFQDFLNNTTITVNNHYYNNTTYVVDDGDYSSTTNIEYNNTTINEGDESSTNNYNNQTEYDYSALNYSLGGVMGGNGSGGGTVFLLDMEFTLESVVPDYNAVDHRNNTIDYSYAYYDYLTNSERTDVFTIQCSDYYLVGSESTNNSTQVSYWMDNSNYWNAWLDQYNQTIANMLENAAYHSYTEGGYYDQHVRLACDENYPEEIWNDVFLVDIEIPLGLAYQCVSIGNYGDWMQEEYYLNWDTGIWDNTPDYSHYNSPDGVDILPYSSRPFDVDYYYESIIPWSCYDGLAGGGEDTVMSVYLDGLVPNVEYRLIVYFSLFNVVNME